MLRERLLKLGARVLVSVRRVVVHLSAPIPFLPAFRRVLWRSARQPAKAFSGLPTQPNPTPTTVTARLSLHPAT
jgi:hypothetical protein